MQHLFDLFVYLNNHQRKIPGFIGYLPRLSLSVVLLSNDDIMAVL